MTTELQGPTPQGGEPVPPAPWDPPPHSPPPGWIPVTVPPSPQAPADPGRARGVRGAAGGAGAAVLAAVKYGAVALKFGKFGPMALSMALSVGALALLYGWSFGVGLVVLILAHEMGHVLFARIEGVKTTLPIFLGPLGALIFTRQPMKDARQEAVIAIGGPFLGTAGALVCAILAGASTGSAQHLLIALAYFGFLLNLFNLTPMLPFDGGRVAGAVSVWLNVVGVAVMGWLIFGTHRVGAGVNPLLVLLFLLGCITTFQRFMKRRELTYLTSVPPRTRAFIGISWVALVALTALGMSMAHQRLIDVGAIDAPVSSQTQAVPQGPGVFQAPLPGTSR